VPFLEHDIVGEMRRERSGVALTLRR